MWRLRDPRATHRLIVGPDPTDVADAVRARGEAIKRREVRRAVAALDGPVSDRERRAILAMADGILEGVLATPERFLRNGADDRHAEAAVRLFEAGDGGPRSPP